MIQLLVIPSDCLWARWFIWLKLTYDDDQTAGELQSFIKKCSKRCWSFLIVFYSVLISSRYKERIHTKYIKSLNKNDSSQLLIAKNWTFLKDGLDDFRDGLPPPIDGDTVLKVGLDSSYEFSYRTYMMSVVIIDRNGMNLEYNSPLSLWVIYVVSLFFSTYHSFT